MDIQAMAEVLLYGALLLGICILLATRALEPVRIEKEEQIPQLRYRRSRGKRKITRYYL